MDFKVIHDDIIEFDGERYYKAHVLKRDLPFWVNASPFFTRTVALRVHSSNYYSDANNEPWGQWYYDKNINIIYVSLHNIELCRKLGIVSIYESEVFFHCELKETFDKFVHLNSKRIFNWYEVVVKVSAILPKWFRYNSSDNKYTGSSRFPHAIVGPTKIGFYSFTFFDKKVMERFEKEMNL